MQNPSQAVNDGVLEFMRRNGMLTGDLSKDRNAYLELNFFGDVRDLSELDGEAQAELSEELFPSGVDD